MTASHDDLRAQVSAYFDGELPTEDEPAVIDHLATCEECQALLGDAVGIDAAVQRAPGQVANAETEGVAVLQLDGEAARPLPTEGAAVLQLDGARARPTDGAGSRPASTDALAPVIPLQSRRRSPIAIVAGTLALAAAIAIAWRVTRPKSPRPDAPVALADHRSLEVRLGGGAFAAHRPYQIERNGARTETVPLAVLAELERRGDPATFAAALAVNGDLPRAAAVLETLPETPAVIADRAAIALLQRDPQRALTTLDGARTAAAPAVAWNRALALRDLDFPLAAAAAFDDAAREGGAWGEEAAARAGALRGDHARRRAAIADVIARGAALVAGTGAPLTAADVATSYPRSRAIFHDALRVAGDAAALDALVPFADALDAALPTDERAARAALERARSGDAALRRRFADRYRAVVARTAPPDAIAALRRELAAAGPAGAELLLGVITLTATGADRVASLERVLAGATDPWFARLLAYERVSGLRAVTPDRAETVARDALRGCGPDRADFRCAQLERVLGELLANRGAFDEATELLDRAVAHYRRAGEPVFEDYGLLNASEVRRIRADWSLARAGFEELLARATDATPCLDVRKIRLGIAEVARFQGEVEVARAALPAADACPPPWPIGLGPSGLITVVDLALQTGDPADRARAQAWLDTARATGGAVVDLCEGRLASDADPARARALLTAALPALSADPDPALAMVAHRSFARAAGATGDWQAILDDAAAERGRPFTGCAIVISPDEQIVIVAARDARGAATGARVTAADPTSRALVMPAAVVDAVAGCAAVDVVARPPMHGRPALLPPGVPWAFVGDARTAPAAAAPRTVIVGDAEPPSGDLRLARLAATDIPAGAVAVTGGAATPSRVLAELATATYAELHAHGVANLGQPGTSFLALSPDADGAWQLTAAAVAGTKLRGAPVVVLGACRAAATTPRWDARWSLPDAFLVAGARAVIAADIDLPDREAAALFGKLRERLARGEAPAAALAAERSAAVAAGQAWAAHLMVFE